MKLYRSILVVDDETRWLRTMTMTLKQEVPEAKVFCCENSCQALDMILNLEIDLVLLDLNMPHIQGEELLAQIMEAAPYTKVIIVTGVNETSTAVRCVKLGADDYYVKGGSVEHLVTCVRRLLEMANLAIAYRKMKQSLLGDSSVNGRFERFITHSAKVSDCIRYLQALTSSPYPIIIEGEEGVGKRLLAECYVEQLYSSESTLFFSLRSVAEEDILRMLFGQVRGANRMGEAAHIGIFEKYQNGVVVLDGILESDAAWVKQILEALTRRRYYPLGSERPQTLNCRVIILTQVSLQAWREDNGLPMAQYVALQTHHLVLPALRERPEDIGLLVSEFIEQIANQTGKTYSPINYETIRQLEALPWAGNVAELKSRVLEAAIRSEYSQLCLKTLLGNQAANDVATTVSATVEFPEVLPTLAEIQQQLIHEALLRTDFNQTAAAKLLGITQSALSRRLK